MLKEVANTNFCPSTCAAFRLQFGQLRPPIWARHPGNNKTTLADCPNGTCLVIEVAGLKASAVNSGNCRPNEPTCIRAAASLTKKAWCSKKDCHAEPNVYLTHWHVLEPQSVKLPTAACAVYQKFAYERARVCVVRLLFPTSACDCVSSLATVANGLCVWTISERTSKAPCQTSNSSFRKRFCL